MIWFPKDEQGLKAAYTEVQRHKAAGRRALLAGWRRSPAPPRKTTISQTSNSTRQTSLDQEKGSFEP